MRYFNKKLLSIILACTIIVTSSHLHFNVKAKHLFASDESLSSESYNREIMNIIDTDSSNANILRTNKSEILDDVRDDIANIENLGILYSGEIEDIDLDKKMVM